jgi:hypothetical protein
MGREENGRKGGRDVRDGEKDGKDGSRKGGRNGMDEREGKEEMAVMRERERERGKGE